MSAQETATLATASPASSACREPCAELAWTSTKATATKLAAFAIRMSRSVAVGDGSSRLGHAGDHQHRRERRQPIAAAPGADELGAPALTLAVNQRVTSRVMRRAAARE